MRSIKEDFTRKIYSVDFKYFHFQKNIVTKTTEFQISGTLRKVLEKKYCPKYMKIYIRRKTNLSAFHCFLFHKKVMYTSQVIALLLTPYMNYRQVFGQFLPHLAQTFNQM